MNPNNIGLCDNAYRLVHSFLRVVDIVKKPVTQKDITDEIIARCTVGYL